jgi:hypothetical protein
MKTEDRYTPESVKQLVEADSARLFAPWAQGRPPGWSTDKNTVALITAGNWLDEELAKVCNDADRLTQVHKYNRLSRSYDVWQAACECINEALDGTVEQGRVPHRRWG